MNLNVLYIRNSKFDTLKDWNYAMYVMQHLLDIDYDDIWTQSGGLNTQVTANSIRPLELVL